MDKKEAKKVLGILSCADGGCHICVGILMREFVKKFRFKKMAIEVYKRNFDEDLFEEEVRDTKLKRGKK